MHARTAHNHVTLLSIDKVVHTLCPTSACFAQAIHAVTHVTQPFHPFVHLPLCIRQVTLIAASLHRSPTRGISCVSTPCSLLLRHLTFAGLGDLRFGGRSVRSSNCVQARLEINPSHQILLLCRKKNLLT